MWLSLCSAQGALSPFRALWALCRCLGKCCDVTPAASVEALGRRWQTVLAAVTIFAVAFTARLYPMLRGGYFFGDFCSGRIWTISAGARSPATRTFLYRSPNITISSFGESESRELYVVDYGGRVLRVVGHNA